MVLRIYTHLALRCRNFNTSTILNMASLKESLILNISPKVETCSSNKVTVVGVGQVGMACALSILTQNISSDICLVDSLETKLRGEMLDLQHGSLFFKTAKINASTDYAITEGSRVCIVTAGVRTRKGETRLDLLNRNTDIMKDVIPKLVRYSPKAVLLIVSNPVDILTQVAAKISGLPKYRVIGAGTNLDSSRFQFFLGKKLGLAPKSCHAWIIGEHGDSSVPVWSGVHVAGVNLKGLNPTIGAPDDPEKWSELHMRVVKSSYEVVRLKGYTSWAISLSVAQIVWSILRNTFDIHAVTVPVKGLHGIKEDVFLSLPAVLGEEGVTDLIMQTLTPSEKEKLQKSAKVMADTQTGLKY